MDPFGGRSKSVNGTLTATAAEAPSTAELAFDRLYRSSRDDLYAYVASPVPAPAAAGGGARTGRGPLASAPPAGARAAVPAAVSQGPGCSESRATPPSTSCAVAAVRPSWRWTRPISSPPPPTKAPRHVSDP